MGLAAPLSCRFHLAGNSRPVRATGFFEQLPLLVIACDGGTPAQAGAPLPFRTVTVTLLNGAELSTRDLATGGGRMWTEALAAIDLPVNNGSATAIWEVINTDSTSAEEVSLDVFASYGAGAGLIGIERSFAPVENGTMSILPSFAAHGASPAGCQYAAAQSRIDIAPEGGSADLEIVTTPGCGWKVDSYDRTSATFVRFEAARDYWQGRGVVRFQVLPNLGPPRATQVVVQGQSFVISQRGGARSSLPPPSIITPSANQTVSGNGAVTLSWRPAPERWATPASASPCFAMPKIPGISSPSLLLTRLRIPALPSSAYHSVRTPSSPEPALADSAMSPAGHSPGPIFSRSRVRFPRMRQRSSRHRPTLRRRSTGRRTSFVGPPSPVRLGTSWKSSTPTPLLFARWPRCELKPR